MACNATICTGTDGMSVIGIYASLSLVGESIKKKLEKRNKINKKEKEQKRKTSFIFDSTTYIVMSDFQAGDGGAMGDAPNSYFTAGGNAIAIEVYGGGGFPATLTNVTVRQFLLLSPSLLSVSSSPVSSSPLFPSLSFSLHFPPSFHRLFPPLFNL
jgi:hypothetical protein